MLTRPLGRCRDPVGRASATELLQHPYLTLDPEWVFTGFK